MMKVESRSDRGNLRLVCRGAASAAVLLGLVLVTGAEAVAQENPVHGSAVTMSSSQATLELDLASGETRTISFWLLWREIFDWSESASETDSTAM